MNDFHNPDSIPQSKVPSGWRMRYAHEAGTPASTRCRKWSDAIQMFDYDDTFTGEGDFTYIVPANASDAGNDDHKAMHTRQTASDPLTERNENTSH